MVHLWHVFPNVGSSQIDLEISLNIQAEMKSAGSMTNGNPKGPGSSCQRQCGASPWQASVDRQLLIKVAGG